MPQRYRAYVLTQKEYARHANKGVDFHCYHRLCGKLIQIGDKVVSKQSRPTRGKHRKLSVGRTTSQTIPHLYHEDCWESYYL